MVHHTALRWSLAGWLLLTAGALPACKLFKKTSPSGHLARTDGPAQYAEAYPNQTTEAWDHGMDPSNWSNGASFLARDVGTLHVWLRYLCSSPTGAFQLTGRVGVSVVGRPPVEPVPVTVTSEGATLQGLPRGDLAPIVGHTPHAGIHPGELDSDGYVYLFDVEAPQQTTVTFTGRISADRPARCFLNYEVRKD